MAAGRARGAALICVLIVALASCTGTGSPPKASPSDGSSPGPTSAGRPPDIVLVMTDDQRWDSLEAMPTVQRDLVAKGMTFANAVVVNPLCCPSRATFLTGQYSHTTGVYTNTKRHGGFEAFRATSTVATWLSDRGYRTGLVGKYLNGYDPGFAGYIPPGWDRWFAVAHEQGSGSGDQGRGYYDYEVSDQGKLRSFGADPGDYSTEVLASRAVQFIRETPKGQPLFLSFAPHAPHLPATPAPRDRNAFSDDMPPRPPGYNEEDVSDKPEWVREEPRFDAARNREVDGFRLDMMRSLLAVDRAVGQLLSALSDEGRLSNTLFVFTSDNGWLGGEHRLTGKNAPYEPSIRIPLVVRFDAVMNGAMIDDRLVANVDVAPTLAEAAGAAAPDVEGQSLLPLLTAAATPWRSDILIEHLQDGKNDVPTFCEVRSTRYAYVAYRTGEQELYDLSVDPGQLTNRAADPGMGTTLSQLRARLRALCQPPPPGFTVP